MEFIDLKEIRKERMIIASHRGVSSANIPCNTLQSYSIALSQGADIIEMDVTKSLDGELFAFHPFMDFPHLRKLIPIQLKTAKQIKNIKYVNNDLTRTQYGISTIDEVLDFLKGKCIINIDKFWNNPKRIIAKLDYHNMRNQVIIKSYFAKDKIKLVSELASDVPYMLMLRNKMDGIESFIKNSGVNLVAEELIFDSTDSSLITDTHLQYLHDNNLFAWVNSIVYNYKDVISAGLTDDRAILGEKDEVWGYFKDKGFDIVQTDWVNELKQYLIK